MYISFSIATKLFYSAIYGLEEEKISSSTFEGIATAESIEKIGKCDAVFDQECLCDVEFPRTQLST